MAAFFAGMACGALIAFIALALAQSAGKKVPGFEAEDKARDKTQADLAAIDNKRDQAHAAIDTFTIDEMDRVLNGTASIDDIVRERAERAARAADPGSVKPAG